MSHRATTLLLLSFLWTTTHAQLALPTATGVLTSGSGNCATCHTGSGSVMVEGGLDISPATQWRSTMMAQAAMDPLWRAKVRSETLHSPDYAQLIMSKCTRCHAPLGSVEAFHGGAEAYSLEEALSDPLARDGVSCTLCHQIGPQNLGQADSFTGGFLVGTQHVINGPYAAPLVGPMQVNSGYTPVLGAHIAQSELCATCHTLFTPWLDNSGQVGGTFPEQVPYLEWTNSGYPAMGRSCQACHMPESGNAQDISTLPPWHTQTRSPYFKHEFVGANAWMTGLLRDHSAELLLTASTAQLDRTRRLGVDMLAQAAQVGVAGVEDGDSLDLMVSVTNLSGHKLPTGIPLRRMWLRVLVVDAQGDTLFQSGAWDDAGSPPPSVGSFEPHHQVIRDPARTQIWEGVMGDANEAPTWILLRASHFLKDNRLPPLGFVTGAPSYADMAVVGVPPEDSDFNREGGVEGSGRDLVHYRLPIPADSFTVRADLLYQAVPPALVRSFDGQDAPEIHAWRSLSDAADYAPLVMASAQWQGPGVLPAPQVDVRVEGGQVLLEWTPVATAMGYRVWSQDQAWTSPGDPMALRLEGVTTDSCFTLPQTGQRTFFRVTAWR